MTSTKNTRRLKTHCTDVRHAEKLADDYVATLVDTQRNWLKYRDGQCKLEAFAAEEGSNANAVATNLCVIRIDKERTAILKQLPY